MSAIHIDTRVPLSGDGYIRLKVSVPNVAATPDRDRAFILQVIDKVTGRAPELGRPVIRDLRPETQRQMGGRA